MKTHSQNEIRCLTSYFIGFRSLAETLDEPMQTIANAVERVMGADVILRKQIEQGLSEAEIKASWQKDLEAFKKIRVKYLIYP